jgi:DNA-binding NarL/FixJ family response regulator
LPLPDAATEAFAVVDRAAEQPTPVAPAPHPAPDSRFGFSPRELEVLELLVAGHTDKEIAEALFISRRTAQGHVGSIFGKLGVNTRTAAATAALRAGLVADEPTA